LIYVMGEDDVEFLGLLGGAAKFSCVIIWGGNSPSSLRRSRKHLPPSLRQSHGISLRHFACRICIRHCGGAAENLEFC
jgi:hypothetical protein